jgi:hypothetical protein
MPRGAAGSADRASATGPATRPVPMICTPAEESGLHSQHPMQTIRGFWAHEKSRPQVYRSYTLRQPASTRIRRAARTPRAARRRPQRAAPPAERQPACRAATFPQRGRTGHTTPAALDRRAVRTSRISGHPPAQAPSRREAGTQALRCPPGTPAIASPPAPRPRASARLNAACEAGMATPADPVRGRPWKADGYTDRATGPDAVRLPASPRDRKWFRGGPVYRFGACFTVLPCPDCCRFLRAGGRVRGREAPARRRRRRP